MKFLLLLVITSCSSLEYRVDDEFDDEDLKTLVNDIDKKPINKKRK